jgi:iron complex outermembrane receptor protein
VGAGGVYTCASNIGVDNPQCVPANLLDPAVLAGNVPAALSNWLFVPITGHTRYEQATAQFNVDGDLFELPAGKVRAAVGLELRHDELNDTPPIESQNRELYNLTSSGVTQGADNIWEVFGEVEIPLLANQVLAKDLRLSLSGRHTYYSSYGSNDTYKIGGNWTPFNFLKIRGTYGTSFRAPGIYERKLGGQSGFYAANQDPCYNFGAKDPGAPLYQNCQIELSAILGPVTDFFPTGGPQVYNSGGSDLKAETSKAATVGFVLQPDFLDISFAVDWFRIKVDNQIATFGLSVLSLCYNDPQFRAGGGYCDLVGPRNSGTGNLTFFQSPYVNIASQTVEGLDFNLRFRHELFDGRVVVNVRATDLYDQLQQLTPTSTNDQYAGLLTYPKWTGDLDVRYEWRSWIFRYGLEYVQKMDSNPFFATDPAADPFNWVTKDYYLHNVSVQFKSNHDWEVTAGMNNVFDKKPPAVGYSFGYFPRVGNSLNYSGYDMRGRSIFVDVTKSF